MEEEEEQIYVPHYDVIINLEEIVRQKAISMIEKNVIIKPLKTVEGVTKGILVCKLVESILEHAMFSSKIEINN